MDVSKIEAGKLQLGIEKFDIKPVVEGAIELIRHSNNNYNVALQTSIDSLIISGDPHRIEQVLINLLTNAIKYSPGSDIVEVFLNTKGNKVNIGVKDYGVGIPADKLTQVFSRFYRIEGANPNISGLGIGLYLSHEIVTRHKGKIWVDSELGKGSIFWLSLPM